jgi:hypothetical protein
VAATSPDGVTWTARTLPSVSNWISIDFAPEPFSGTATALQLSLIGLTPALTSGYNATATALQLSLIGLRPSSSFSFPFIGTPASQAFVAYSGLVPSLVFGLVASPTIKQIDLTGLTPGAYFGHFIGQPVQSLINFNGLTPSSLAMGFAGTPTQAYLDWIGNLGNLVTRNVNAPPLGWSAVRYRCFLTPPDSTVFDIELPISSFQSRLRLDGLSYLSVVLKGADAYVDQIGEAANRQMCIFREYHYLDGYINSTVMASTAYETLQIAEGGKSGVTATLAGNGDFVPSDSATIELKDPTYRSYAGGYHRYRCAIDARLRPGDTAQINGDSFVVNEIVYVIDTQTAIMEISG